MSWDSKVIWSEGMFLRTHHFQQFDRYVEKLVRGRAAGLRGHSWGVSELEINRDLLSTGKFAITRCVGTFDDGTPFAIPEGADHPPPLVVPESARNAVVYLTLPVSQPGGIEVERGARNETGARYATSEFEARDINAGSETVVPIEIGRLRLRYGLETEELNGYSCIGLARIIEVRADKAVVLDDRYISPTLSCAAVPSLAGFLSEVQGLLHHRGEALAGRVTESGARGVAEIQDFLLLQLVNRYEPLLAHQSAERELHPEIFYSVALELAGELATFFAPTKRPPQFPSYRHDDLQKTFQPVMASLRQFLSAVLEQTAIPIPLQERKYGIRVGQIPDKGLLVNAAFILVVKAEMPADTLRRHFPTQVKIGPVEQIRELVNVALPGITLRALPVAPRQIPFTPGATYFEMDRASRYWEELKTSGGLAIHVAGDFPSLTLECWAIKS